MANFTCETNLATGCPDVRLHGFWVCLWGCIWMISASELVEWGKQTAHPAGHLPICAGRAWIGNRGREDLLPASWSWTPCLLLYPCTVSGPAPQASGLTWDQLCGVLQPTDSTSWDFSPSRILWANFSLYVSSASLLTPTNSLAYYVRGYFWLFHWEQMWTICLLKHAILQKNALNMIKKIS